MGVKFEGTCIERGHISLNQFLTKCQNIIWMEIYYYVGILMRGQVADFISNDDDIHVPVAENYLQDRNINLRISQDSTVDTRGCELISQVSVIFY